MSTPPATRPTDVGRPPGPVMHVISGLGVGGAEKMLTELVAELQSRGIEQYVFSLSAGGKYSAVLRSLIGDRCVELNVTSPLAALAGMARLRKAVREVRPAVIQGWMYHGDLFAAIASLSVFGRDRSRLYWGVRCSDLDLSAYSLQLRVVVNLCRLLSSLPKAIIANSRVGLEAHAKGGYRNPHFHHVPNCVDGDLYRPDEVRRRRMRESLGIPPDKFVFLIVARVDPMKGFDLFLELARKYPDCVALAAGRDTDTLDGPANYRGLGVRNDVPDLLSASDLLVSTSLFGEGQSNSLMEAMASGLPVLTSDTGDSADLVANGGVIVKPGDFDGFVQGLEFLAGNSAERERMGTENRRRILSEFSRAQMADRFLAVYAE